jgi:WD40 repeat protein
VCGQTEAIGWMGECCAGCHDRQEEGEPGEGQSKDSPSTLRGHSAAVMGVAFDSKGKTIVSAGEDGNTCFWHAATGKPRTSDNLYVGATEGSIPFASNGRTVVLAGYGGELHFDAVTGRKLEEYENDHSAWMLRAVALSPDGELQAEGGQNYFALWRAEHRGGNLVTGRSTEAETFSLAFSPDSQTLARGGTDIIDLFDAKGERGRRLSAVGGVGALRFSPDGGSLLAGYGTGEVVCWDLKSAKPEARVLGRHSGSVHALAVSPDGKTLASGGGDRVVRLWDLTSMQELAALEWHIGTVFALAFSPDGQTLGSGSGDGTVKLWPWRQLLEA